MSIREHDSVGIGAADDADAVLAATYTFIDDGTYLWTSPRGYQFLRDHHGTLDVSRDRCQDLDTRLAVLGEP